MKKLGDVFLILGVVGWAIAIATRMAQKDVIFPALQLPAQTYLDFGWTCLFIAGVLMLRVIREKKD